VLPASSGWPAATIWHSGRRIDFVPEGNPLLSRRGVAQWGRDVGREGLRCFPSDGDLRAYFVRKEAKKYGTERLCEGGDIGGKRLLIIEDVVTTGGQILLSAQDLRAEGAFVDHALCVIDREAGRAGRLASEGIVLRPLFTMTDLELD
jgi:hypothetical protein